MGYFAYNPPNIESKKKSLFFSLNVEQNLSEMETCFIRMLDHGALPYTYSSHLSNDKQICLSTMMRAKVLKPCSQIAQMNDTAAHSTQGKQSPQPNTHHAGGMCLLH